jgi:hypothetical protein
MDNDPDMPTARATVKSSKKPSSHQGIVDRRVR